MVWELPLVSAYANDFIEKTWPMNYAERGADYLTGGRGPQRNGNIAVPAFGYLWDAAKRAGVTVRNYGIFGHRGEVVDEDSGKGAVVAYVSGLQGIIHPEYPPWDLRIPDNKRIDVWLKEFRKFEQEGICRSYPSILGIEPMSQYDAAATPAYAAFQTAPDFTPYTLRPARISLEEKNRADAFGTRESMAMNFREVDRIPMREMNEILWKSVKGANSPMPPPVRSAFIHPFEEDDE